MGKELIGYIVDEVTQVAHQLGIQINKERIMQTIEKAAAPDTSGHHLPSMLQDILKEQKTEIEAINGSIIREAEKYNIAVPCNKIVYNLIKIIEDHF